jgi:iron complex outermembrane receptor protein
MAITVTAPIRAKLSHILMILCVFGCCRPVLAGRTEPNEAQDLFEMSIEELMEVPVVTSASRLPQKTGESSASVYVITAEDIRRSGLTSIPEILQFAPGVDVLKIDRRRYAVGIRGLHETSSD